MSTPPPSGGPPRPKTAHVPMARPISESLAAPGQLTHLLAQVRASRARQDDLHAILPQPLHALLQPGPLDDEGWTLLAPNPAVAAKLRQWLPTIAEHLQARGWPATPVRLKIQGGAGAR